MAGPVVCGIDCGRTIHRERSTAGKLLAFKSGGNLQTRHPAPRNQPKGISAMKKSKLLIALAIAALSGSTFAQTTTAIKESGKAVAEKAMEGKETVQAAAMSEPKKSVHKAKAKSHKQKAAMHDTKAKAAGAQIGK